MSNPQANHGYYIDPDQRQNLRDIMDSLYADKPLTPDSRRDLANRMHSLIGKIEDQALNDEQAQALGVLA
ncbi:hypothetical protein YA0089_27175 [Pseudomonas viridiflava]|uniref:hypothetical protein n=1 Tax=Pseudomonas viridiflava TaxID=33069 RepID=UPI0018E5BA8F|nr:hypothetical protein [Pseudomonas viridiflava]MBI6727301.1 hypothetical protein [Pseudomonas viridiflava]